MIKKLIGIVTAVAVIVVIVIAALHRDRYRSMVFGGAETPAEQRTYAPQEVAVPAADALSERIVIDSLTVVTADSPADSVTGADSVR